MTEMLSLVSLERRVSALERLIAVGTIGDGPVLLLRHADGRLRSQRFPKFWHDLPVRQAAIACHRQMTIAAAVAQLVATFGKARAPSDSALQRLWKQIDLAHEVAELRQVALADAPAAERSL